MNESEVLAWWQMSLE